MFKLKDAYIQTREWFLDIVDDAYPDIVDYNNYRKNINLLLGCENLSMSDCYYVICGNIDRKFFTEDNSNIDEWHINMELDIIRFHFVNSPYYDGVYDIKTQTIIAVKRE